MTKLILSHVKDIQVSYDGLRGDETGSNSVCVYFNLYDAAFQFWTNLLDRIKDTDIEFQINSPIPPSMGVPYHRVTLKLSPRQLEAGLGSDVIVKALMEHCDNLPSTLTIAMPRDNRYLLTDKEMILLSDFAMLANPLDEFQRQVAEKNGALQSCLTALCGDNVEMKTQTYLGKSPELQITCTDAHKVKTLKRNLLDLALEHNKDSFIHFNRVLDVAGQPYDNRFIIKLKHGFDLHQFLLEHGERNLAQKSCPGSSSS